MVKRNMALSLSLALITSAQVAKAESVPIPAWHEQIDRLVGALSTVSELFKKSEDFYNEWDSNLKPLHGELAQRDVERKAVLACASATLKNKIAAITLLNISIEERNVIIAQLKAHVSYLESEVSRINKAIKAKQIEEQEIRAAYEEILGENAEKASEFLSLIVKLQGEYARLVKERDEFRGNLEEFYGALQAHVAAAREDNGAAAREICGNDYNLSA